MKTVTITGKEFNVLSTTPARFKALRDTDKLLVEYHQENPDNPLYILDEEFRAKYWRAVTDAILEPVDGEDPSDDFFQSEDFEFSVLEDAVHFFVHRQR